MSPLYFPLGARAQEGRALLASDSSLHRPDYFPLGARAQVLPPISLAMATFATHIDLRLAPTVEPEVEPAPEAPTEPGHVDPFERPCEPARRSLPSIDPETYPDKCLLPQLV